MSDATCKTCPWSQFLTEPAPWDSSINLLDSAQCRKNPPPWLTITPDDWCGEHPDRQPHLECVTTTLVTHDDDGPSAADMRRIVDALEKMATCAAVKP